MKSIGYIATALMLIRSGYEIGKHEHIHHEALRWEVIYDSAVRTSHRMGVLSHKQTHTKREPRDIALSSFMPYFS